MVGVSQQAIYNARNGNKLPDAWVRRAALQFNLSADWLLFGTGSMYREGAQSPEVTPEAGTPPIETHCAAVEGTLTLTGMQAAMKILEEELAKAKEAERAALIEAKEAYKLAYDAARIEAAKAKEAGPSTITYDIFRTMKK
jgi:hypothetical protein